MARSERAKGLAAEAEVARIYRAAGLTVRGLEGAGDHLVLGAAGLVIHSEVKRQERCQLPLWVRQADAEAPPDVVPVIAWRGNRMAWRADLPLAALAALLARQQLAAEVAS
jgi:hypothetical protein